MSAEAQRARLRALVGELNGRVEVVDPDAVAATLAENVTARNLASVTALTNKKKLTERAADARKVDEVYARLKKSGHQAVTDRYIHVLLKLFEAPNCWPWSPAQALPLHRLRLHHAI